MPRIVTIYVVLGEDESLGNFYSLPAANQFARGKGSGGSNRPVVEKQALILDDGTIYLLAKMHPIRVHHSVDQMNSKDRSSKAF